MRTFLFHRGACCHRGLRNRKGFALFILFVISLSVALFYNGQRALWDTSETRYAEAAREMVASGNWLVPHIAGQAHLTKPPVAYWLIGCSIRVFGNEEWAVRLPVALAFALSVMLTACLAWRLNAGHSGGILAGLLQLVSPLAFFGSHVVTTDTFVSLFSLSYLAAMWAALEATDTRQSRRWAIAMHLGLAVAFLTKGPPALLPALAAVVFLVFRHRFHPWKRLIYIPGIMLFLALSASWYATVLWQIPNALAVWKNEAIHKVFVSSSRDMSAGYFPLILVAGALPAVVILIAQSVKRRIQHKPVLKPFVAQHREATWFLICWIFLPLLIFMLSKTRLILYVLPLVPAINILAAMYATSLSASFASSLFPRKYIYPLAATLLILMGLKVLVAEHGDLTKDMKPVAAAIRNDAQNLNMIPELLVTMDTMGNGLLYYLDGPPIVRVGKSSIDEPGAFHTVSLADLFAVRVPADQRQYIIVSNSKMERYARRLTDVAAPVFFNGQWAVFRRTCNQPVELPRKTFRKEHTGMQHADMRGCSLPGRRLLRGHNPDVMLAM